VHRLDKEVSGVMLFAKIAAAHKLLNRQFFKRTINKTYTALVLGFVKEDKGSIDKAIRRFGSGRMGVDDKSGKPCTTNFEVINRREQTTLIRAFPVTGRRHQIRVHLYHLGHPVAGDMLYGDRNLQKTFPRLMLHATKIRFQDSQKNEITVTSDLPKEFV
jgi:RluA family pseudouridine synthase